MINKLPGIFLHVAVCQDLNDQSRKIKLLQERKSWKFSLDIISTLTSAYASLNVPDQRISDAIIIKINYSCETDFVSQIPTERVDPTE